MTANRTRPSKLVEFVQNLEFTELEEYDNRQEMEKLRKRIITVIGKKGDNVIINSKTMKAIVDVAVKQALERLISGGDHSDHFKRVNAKAHTTSDEKNVMLRIFSEKKSQINELLQKQFVHLFRIAGMHLLKGRPIMAINRYHQIADIISRIRSMDKDFNENIRDVLKSKETAQLAIEMNQESPRSSKTMNRRKRDRQVMDEESNGEPIRKAGKKNVEEDSRAIRAALQKADEEMLELRKNGLKPFQIDDEFKIRILTCINDLKHQHKREKRLADKLGGKDKVEKDLKKEMDRFSRGALEKRQYAEMNHRKVINEWDQNSTQHLGMFDLIFEIMRYDETTAEIFIDKIGWDRIEPVLKNMPFWPVFVNSKRHFQDGKNDEASVYHRAHLEQNTEECMGICNGKSVAEISKSYKKATCYQVFEKMHDFIDDLEELRTELFDDFSKMINYFNKLKPSDAGKFQMDALEIFQCKHKILNTNKMSLNYDARKAEKEKLKCCVCGVSHTLAHLRFFIGTGDFHGKMRSDGKKPIDEFVALLVKFGQVRSLRLDYENQLNDFKVYMDHLRQTTVQIQSSIESINTYSNQLFKLHKSVSMFGIKHLRELEGNKTLPDNQFLDTYLAKYDEESQLNWEKLDDAMTRFPFLITTYGEKLKGKEEDEEEKCCVICMEERIVFVNLPCGHKTCAKCHDRLRKFKKSDIGLECAQCRHIFNHDQTIVVRREVEPEKEKDGTQKKTLTVKMNETIKLMKEIIGKDARNNKILLFTTAEVNKPIWNFLVEQLQNAKMPFAPVTRVGTNPKVSTAEFSVRSKILLCSTSTCKDDFNVVGANHVIFLDSTVPFTGVGKKICKHGQQPDIKLYHMIVKESIDVQLQRISKTPRNNGEQQRKGMEFTVGELRKMFGIPK